MKKTVPIGIFLLLLAGAVSGQHQEIKLEKNLSPHELQKPPRPDLVVRAIVVPQQIHCREPFLKVTVEVWNIGNKEYNPAEGLAELYGDLHNASNSANNIVFFSQSMNQAIQPGHFQKWAFSFNRNSLYPDGRANLDAATQIRIAFVADEQAVTKDANWQNNILYSGSISTTCSGSPFALIGKARKIVPVAGAIRREIKRIRTKKQ